MFSKFILGETNNSRKKTSCTRENIERVVNKIRENRKLSIRQLTKELNLTKYCVHTSLKKKNYYPYHYQQVQHRTEIDRETRLRFCLWAVAKYEANPYFFKDMLFSDECLFTNEGLYNHKNQQFYAQENPHLIIEKNFQVL